MKTPREMAREILEIHVSTYLMGIVEESENEDDLRLSIVEECSFILIDRWLEEKWELLYYEAVRNELTILLATLLL